MVHEIEGVVLFVSTPSEICNDVMRYVAANKLNVNVVRLDTAEDRRRAATGKFVQVTSVPTMVVIFKDNTLQQYLGAEKILGWMSNVVKGIAARDISVESAPHHSHPSSQHPPPQPPHHSEEAKPKKSSKKTKRRKHRSRKVVQPSSDSEEHGDFDIDFSAEQAPHYEEPAYAEPERHMERSSGRSERSRGRTDRRRPETAQYNEEITPEYVAAQEKLKGLMVNSSDKKKNQKSSMSSVAEMARKMQEERNATLGYGEEHNPY